MLIIPSFSFSSSYVKPLSIIKSIFLSFIFLLLILVVSGHNDDIPKNNRPDMRNVTCFTHSQPLDHFGPSSDIFFNQRYCVYRHNNSNFNNRDDDNNNSNDVKFDDKESLLHGGDTNNNNSPIFFYAGNESPIEEYVNNTGLMWDLVLPIDDNDGDDGGGDGDDDRNKHHYYKNALLIFAEHRFQGTSFPDYESYWHPSHFRRNDNKRKGETKNTEQTNNNTTNNNNNNNNNNKPTTIVNRGGCFTHLTLSQTMADYISLLTYIDPSHQRPVIVFGGSYGGMLSVYMRMKYPHIISGAISSSGPIWGLPLIVDDDVIVNNKNGNDNDNENDSGIEEERIDAVHKVAPNTIDGAAIVVSRALDAPVTTSDDNSNNVDNVSNNHYCRDNLIAAWPLITHLSRTSTGRSILHQSLRLCNTILPPNNNHDDSSNSNNNNDTNTDNQTINNLNNNLSTILLSWIQSPWFDLSESNYPYRSSYVPFALGMGEYELPKWPLREACQRGGLNNNIIKGVSIHGDLKNVTYTVSYGVEGGEDKYDDNNHNAVDDDIDDILRLMIDWDEVWEIGTNSSNKRNNDDNDNDDDYMKEGNYGGTVAITLLEGVREAVSVWFNVSGNINCFDAIPAINKKRKNIGINKMGRRKWNNNNRINNKNIGNDRSGIMSTSRRHRHLRQDSASNKNNDSYDNSNNDSNNGSYGSNINNNNGDDNDRSDIDDDVTHPCALKIERETTWTSLVCNEDMIMATTLARGLGNDMYWPPSHPRGTKTYADVVTYNKEHDSNGYIGNGNDNGGDDGVENPCDDPTGIYGYAGSERFDPWSKRMDDRYGGRLGMRNGRSLSNVVFTNGAMDPWISAGVVVEDYDDDRSFFDPNGIMVRNVTMDGSVVSIVLDKGAHHLDLMFVDKDHDPPCAKGARDIEKEHIRRWVEEWNDGSGIGSGCSSNS